MCGWNPCNHSSAIVRCVKRVVWICFGLRITSLTNHQLNELVAWTSLANVPNDLALGNRLASHGCGRASVSRKPDLSVYFCLPIHHRRSTTKHWLHLQFNWILSPLYWVQFSLTAYRSGANRIIAVLQCKRRAGETVHNPQLFSIRSRQSLIVFAEIWFAI